VRPWSAVGVMIIDGADDDGYHGDDEDGARHRGD